MKAEITFSQVYWNLSLMNFFFRSQSENTLNELLERSADKRTAIEKIDDFAEFNDYDLDELEEDFYNDSVAELAERFGIELNEEEEEE